MNQAVMKLDELGKPAWIALMVVGFVLFWPIGLGILAFLLWSGRMGCGRSLDRMEDRRARWAAKWERKMERFGMTGRVYPSSGNRAFDEYREETLKRLEDEQREFRDFLDRLKMAKDKQEFDEFIRSRRAGPTITPDAAPAS